MIKREQFKSWQISFGYTGFWYIIQFTASRPINYGMRYIGNDCGETIDCTARWQP